MNGLLISPDTVSIVHLTQEDRWVRLELWLSREFTGGELVAFAPDATVSLEGTDEVSASYRRANWLSGITSGALYAFRTLALPRQHLVLTDLTGRLRASDMDALAKCSALAVAQLAGKQFPNVALDGWTIQTQSVERRAVPSHADKRQQLPDRADLLESAVNTEPARHTHQAETGQQPEADPAALPRD